ncbi:hypothetical protein DA01_05855 [Dehalococcoides mccartyi]|uniref:Uncharacterized protein n=1 Tax=Dehalococcoides mccartyi TaxID=61435 RepID=A0A0V8LXU0_9CHLR|nr:hypothetical protein [Dehalococcoides mccartyi]KSV16327.1 hypothetical protein DA01_05855 [Dehalococcoides mccartyi]
MPKWYGGYVLNGGESSTEEWKIQWGRVGRWFERVNQIRIVSETPGTDLEAGDFDVIIAFFENCYHLRDWLEVSRPDLNKKINDFFASHFEMKGCRDVCHGFKHKKLTRPSLDAYFNIVRVYDYLEEMGSGPHKNPVKYNIAFAEGNDIRKYDLFDFAERCFDLWKGFLSAENLM